MPNAAHLMTILGLCVILCPIVLLVVLGFSSLVSRRLPEEVINRLLQSGMIAGLASSTLMLIFMLPMENPHVPIEIGNWVKIPEYEFHIKLIYDRLSIPFVMLSYILSGTILAFASRYMHREPGYNRFFTLNAVFLLGMVTTSLAGTIETLFAGWELVGLSSAFLVAFFHERAEPVRNGLRVWCVYRVSDAALLIAALTLHHFGHSDFEKVLGTESWPYGKATVSEHEALVVGLLMLLAAAGKSALIPFCGWLPRAMEGPTPSSAVFYGALSVHLGAFLLLRISPMLVKSPLLEAVIVTLGISTAIYASIVGRVQTDIKSAICFASLTQVAIIVAEIGIGLRFLPLVHILGNACLRTLQFVRAPTLLQDYRQLENAIGDRLPRLGGFWDRMLPRTGRTWLYRFAIERGYLDALIDDYVVAPFVAIFRFCDRMERRWTDYLSGGKSRESDRLNASPGSLEEFL
ncbi:MAG: oxidoreductase [Planctomycetes bacterium]|nr:oxidoreductase [Planctomycetota bacterium]